MTRADPQKLADFAAWWSVHRAEVEAEVERRRVDVQRLRAHLEALVR